LIGDVAIFVNYDSADVWTHREIFELNEDLSPIRVSGVPPDYFSATGQRWGNPIYKWDVLESRGFDWWVDRMRRALALYDIIRLDHFRGFEAFWAIPAEDETAIHGEWVKAPGAALFTALHDQLGTLPLIAEDLGLITREVDALREQFDLPGMRVLQFAFSSRSAHNYLPHRYVTNTVVYTGTHDNDTTLGWWQHGTTDQEKNWPAFEQAIRDLVKLRVQRMQDREADSARSNPFDQLQRRASAMSEFGAALKGFADAGMPLYQSLSDAQQHRFSLLSHFLPTRWIAVEAKQRTKGHGKDQDSDDD